MRAGVWLGAAFLTLGCGGAPARSTPEAPPLHLQPSSELVPAAGLVWLLDARPRELLAVPEMAAHLRSIVPDERFAAFARRHGGVDLRVLSELEVAAYPKATLFVARGVFDPAAIEQAFAARAKVEGRAVDRRAGPLGSITREWGTVGAEREQLAIFGHQAIGLEIGQFGPLRAAEFFAEEKLKRASPALRAPPLARAAALLGDAPLRAFAAGPFSGEWSHGLGGLLGASTAAALSVTVLGPDPSAPGDDATSARLSIRFLLLGAWKESAAAVVGRLSAALHVLSESAVGRLLGIDHTEPRVYLAADDALAAEVTLSALPLFRGLQMATGAGADSVLLY